MEHCVNKIALNGCRSIRYQAEQGGFMHARSVSSRHMPMLTIYMGEAYPIRVTRYSSIGTPLFLAVLSASTKSDKQFSSYRANSMVEKALQSGVSHQIPPYLISAHTIYWCM